MPITNQKILFKPAEVARLIDRGEAVLIDVRDPEFYREGHIAGAANIPEVFYYLATTTDEGLAELNRTFTGLFSKAGLTRGKSAIFYEDSLTKRYCGSCRGVWLARYLGHGDSGILYGGLDAWKSLGNPLESGDFTPVPAEFIPAPRSELVATTEDVVAAMKDPSVILLDDRDEDEWKGESSSPYGIRFAPRMGRIPGARWIEWRRFLRVSAKYPAFKTPREITALCAKHGIHPDDDIIIYCFKGARASNTFIALTLAGFKRLRIYFGSWNEWSRHPELPIEE